MGDDELDLELSDGINEESDDADNIVQDNLVDSIYGTAYNMAVITANNLKYIHFYSKGDRFDRLHQIASDYYDKAGEDMDFLAELALEQGFDILNPSNCSESYSDLVLSNTDGYTYDQGIQEIISVLNLYLESLISLSTNPQVSQDVQSPLDDMVRYWSKEVNYKLVRRL